MVITDLKLKFDSQDNESFTIIFDDYKSCPWFFPERCINGCSFAPVMPVALSKSGFLGVYNE